jgi:RecJ-like exonuclease
MLIIYSLKKLKNNMNKATECKQCEGSKTITGITGVVNVICPSCKGTGKEQTMEERFDKRFVSFNLKHQEMKDGKPFDGTIVADGCGSADEYIKAFIKNEIALAVQQERERCSKLIPDQKPFSVFSSYLKGEELEQYMQYKGFNECREDTIKAINQEVKSD